MTYSFSNVRQSPNGAAGAWSEAPTRKTSVKESGEIKLHSEPTTIIEMLHDQVHFQCIYPFQLDMN